MPSRRRNRFAKLSPAELETIEQAAATLLRARQAKQVALQKKAPPAVTRYA